MSLQTVLAGIDAGWYAGGDGDGDIAHELVVRARGSALGERMLARWLLETHATALLGPTAEREVGVVAVRWPRERLVPLTRDLGVLALAPAIRAEIGRDAVRKLKQALGNSYLLALDRGVWDGRVQADVMLQMAGDLSRAMSAAREDDRHEALYALLEHHGRCELRAWAREQQAALGEWATLLYPAEEALATVLPAKQVQMLHEHHLARGTSRDPD